MNILDLKFQLDRIIREQPEMVDFDVVFRNYKSINQEGEGILIAEDSPLAGYFCDRETNEFCLMTGDSFDIWEEFNDYEDDEYIKE